MHIDKESSGKHMYEDISDFPIEKRKCVARERWESMPSVIHDIFANAPKKAMYEALRRLRVDAAPARAVEWCYPTTDGGLVVTVWHDHIQKSPEGALVYYIPINRWRGAGVQPARAQQLQDSLKQFVGQDVIALLLKHEWDKNDTQFAKRVAIDQRKWWVEALSDNEFLLWRGGRKT